VLESSRSASATDAIEYFVGRIRMGIDGLDALILTGGIGKNSNRIRAATLAGMDWLGTALDKTANQHHEQIISAAQSRRPVFVLKTDEEVADCVPHHRDREDRPAAGGFLGAPDDLLNSR
jgi:acetate kinase